MGVVMHENSENDFRNHYQQLKKMRIAQEEKE